MPVLQENPKELRIEFMKSLRRSGWSARKMDLNLCATFPVRSQIINQSAQRVPRYNLHTGFDRFVQRKNSCITTEKSTWMTPIRQRVASSRIQAKLTQSPSTHSFLVAVRMNWRSGSSGANAY